MDKGTAERRLESAKKELQAHFEKAQQAMQENDFCGARCYLDMAERDATVILTYESVLESIKIWG